MTDKKNTLAVRGLVSDVTRQAIKELAADDVISQFMLTLKDAVRPNYRKPQFRASSLPFCPLLHTLNSGHSEVQFQSQFYFSVGTTLHELVQSHAHRNAFGRKYLWGDWKCLSCGRMKHHRLKPKKRCKCGAPKDAWEYEEVTVEFNGISGHIDTILKIGKYYFVLDYKTTGKPYNGARLNAAKYPYRGNVVQISFYSYVLKEKYGIDVRGWSLIYVDRAKPLKDASDFVQIHQEWTTKNHARMGKRIKWMTDRIPLTQRVWDRIHVEGKYPNPKDIKNLVDNRPCKTEKDWSEWMNAAFERGYYEEDKVCEHLDVCLGSCKKALKHFEQLYATMVE